VAHKTITISEEAYNALAAKKEEHESFTDVILRVTSDRGKASSLLKLIESWPPDEDLANSIESAMKRTRKAKLRRVNF
jgi:predicted CopG family antitoxin